MRPTWRAHISVLIVACSAIQLSAAESGSRWWPFGRHDETQSDPAATVSPPSQAPLQTQGAYSSLNPALPATGTQESLTQATPPPVSSAKESWMLSSPKRKVSWPRLTKPKLPETGLFAQKTDPDATRNTWVDKSPTEPKASPLQPIKTGAQKVAKGSKAAWHKTVDALTPGEPEPPQHSNSSRIAKSDAKPTMWQRMFGEKEETRQPQTVPEWMAQDRVDRR